MTTHPTPGQPSLSDGGQLSDTLSFDFSPPQPGGPIGTDPGLWLADDASGGANLLGGGATPNSLDQGAKLSYLDEQQHNPSSIILPTTPSSAESGITIQLPAVQTPTDFASGLLGSGPPGLDVLGLSHNAGGSSGGPGGGTKGGGGGGGGGSTTATYSKGSLTFNVTYDSSVNSAPSGFVSGFKTAIDYFLDNFNSPITIKLDVGWGEVGGRAIDPNALAESLSSMAGVSYSSLYQQMTNVAAQSQDADQLQAYSTLTATNPLPSSNYDITAAEAKALGYRLIGNTKGADGDVGFSTLSGTGYDWNFDPSTPFGGTQFDFVHIADHEISEVMGRMALVGNNTSNAYSALDLFRYAGTDGTRSTGPGVTGYLSLDGGKTNLSNFNTDPAQGDLGDWAVPNTVTANDAYNYKGGTGLLQVSSVDGQEMNVLGYTRASTATFT